MPNFLKVEHKVLAKRLARRGAPAVGSEAEFLLVYKGNVLWVIEGLLAREAASVGKVLLYLIFGVRYRNVVMETIEKLGERSGLSAVTASEALGRLEALRIIRRPMRGQFEVNPYLAWMGGDRDREKEQLRWVSEMAWLDPAGRSGGLPHEERGKVIEMGAAR